MIFLPPAIRRPPMTGMGSSMGSTVGAMGQQQQPGAAAAGTAGGGAPAGGLAGAAARVKSAASAMSALTGKQRFEDPFLNQIYSSGTRNESRTTETFHLD